MFKLPTKSTEDMMQADAGEAAYTVKLSEPMYKGIILYNAPQEQEFKVLDARGWQYEMRFSGNMVVNNAVVHQYKVFLLNKRMTRREILIEKMDYCLHEHWGLAADPRYDYRASVYRLSTHAVMSLLIKVELTHALMVRHQRQEDLILTTYNKLIECFGWATNTVFVVDETSSMLIAELLN